MAPRSHRSARILTPPEPGPGDADTPAQKLAQQLARGVARTLGDLGYASLFEFTLRSGRRVDVMAIEAGGEIVIVEIKISLEDFRSDTKWPEYLEFCDRFFFAVPEGFPSEILPEDCGLMIADAYGASILREAPALGLNGSRRRAQVLRFALAAAQRLNRLIDPHGMGPR